jgi:hypothetical protein
VWSAGSATLNTVVACFTDVAKRQMSWMRTYGIWKDLTKATAAPQDKVIEINGSQTNLSKIGSLLPTEH